MCNINEHGNNADIQVHVLSDERMREIGFVSTGENSWFIGRGLCNSVSFDFFIKEGGKEWYIDIVDDDFGQPYDYQYYLTLKNPPKFAYMVKAKVDKYMRWLVKEGVISNWKVGDYI